MTETEVDLTADTAVIDGVVWDSASVTLDGRLLNQDGEEMEVGDVLAALAAVYHKIKRMVAAAKGEEVPE